MSIERPNVYEQLIEKYAEAVRRQAAADVALTKASSDMTAARNWRQQCWLEIRKRMNDGTIKAGVYRINKGPDMFAEALLIAPEHDYPDLLPMFR